MEFEAWSKWKASRSGAERAAGGGGCAARSRRPGSLAGVEAPGGAAAAAQRALHQRVGRQAMPVLGHALAVGDADDLELVADQRVERRAELDGLVDLARTTPAQAAAR